MSRIFVTGSADGLGKMAADLLVRAGHEVVVHARNEERSETAKAAVHASAAVFGDLSSIEETRLVADQINELGNFDAVIHNAGIGYQESKRVNTADGLPYIFAVNSLAPYILTCLIKKPKRLVYISSGLHRNGSASLDDLDWKVRRWNGVNAYADSKLHDVIIAFAVARKWKDVFSNAVEPGWVATKMGGPGAPDSLEDGPKTQVWLAASNDRAAMVSGEYFYHQKLHNFNSAAADVAIQETFLGKCARFSNISFPA